MIINEVKICLVKSKHVLNTEIEFLSLELDLLINQKRLNPSWVDTVASNSYAMLEYSVSDYR